MVWDPLTAEQRELRDLVRTLARERIAPRAAEIDASHEFPWDVVEALPRGELFGLLLRGGGGRHRHRRAARARRDRGGVEGLRDVGLLLAVQELGSLGLKLAGSREQQDGGCLGSPRARCWPRTR